MGAKWEFVSPATILNTINFSNADATRYIAAVNRCYFQTRVNLI